MNDFVVIYKEEHGQYGVVAVPCPVKTESSREGLMVFLRETFDAATSRPKIDLTDKFVLGDTGLKLDWWAFAKLADGPGLNFDFAPPEILTVQEWFERGNA